MVMGSFCWVVSFVLGVKVGGKDREGRLGFFVVFFDIQLLIMLVIVYFERCKGSWRKGGFFLFFLEGIFLLVSLYCEGLLFLDFQEVRGFRGVRVLQRDWIGYSRLGLYRGIIIGFYILWKFGQVLGRQYLQVNSWMLVLGFLEFIYWFSYLLVVWFQGGCCIIQSKFFWGGVRIR